MIDFLKFGFVVKEINGVKCVDKGGVTYENELLEIQHWTKPDICVIAIRRENFIEWRGDDTGGYVIKDNISESGKKFARHILDTGSLYNFPLYIGVIKGETFFEILISSVCTDTEKIMQCGS